MRSTPYRVSRSTVTGWIVGTAVMTAGLLAPVVSAAAEVNSARPRLFITPADLPLIRARIGVTDGNNQSTYPTQWNTHGSEYSDLEDYVLSHPGFEDSDNTSEEYFEVIALGAFMYLMDGNTQGADKAIDIWTDYINDPDSGVRGNPWGHTSGYYFAAAYDWLFDHMSSSERTFFGEWLLDVIEFVEADGFLDPESVEDGDHDYHGGYHSSSMLTTLLALYGSGVASDSWILDRLDFYDEYKSVDYASHYNKYGYGSFGGYAQYIMICDILGAWAMQSAMNRDLFAQGYSWTYQGVNGYVRTPEFFSGIGRWVIATHRSDMTETDQPGDAYYSELKTAVRPSRSHYLMYKMTQEYDEPYLKAFTDGVYYDTYGRYGVGSMWSVVLNDKTDTGDINDWPDLLQLNCDRDQGGFGCGHHHVMRPSWDFLGQDYIHVMVTAGNSCPHFRLASSGSYDIAYGRWMLTGQSAAYDATTSVHFEEYNRKTWAFNLVDVGGRGFNRSSHQYTTFLRKVDRDDYRGLHMDLTETLPNPDNDGSPIVESTYREIGQLSDRFVCVFDRVIAMDGDDEKVVNLHSYAVDPPMLIDGSWDGGVVENAHGGTPGRTSSDATRFSWPAINWQEPLNISGPQLVTSVISPTDFTLRKVGGPNSQGVWSVGDPAQLMETQPSIWGTTEGLYEWTTDDYSGRYGEHDISFESYNRATGRNWPWHERGFRNDVQRIGNAGRWRMEIVPDTGRREDLVLVVHEVITSPGTGTPVTETFSFEEGESGLPQFVGAQIGTTEGWVVMFNAGDQPATAVSYETQGALIPEKHRISGMKSGLYEVLVDGIPRLQVESVADEGFLSFNTRGRRIEIRPLFLADGETR